MSSTKQWRYRTAFAAAICCLGVVTACGSSDETSQSASGAAKAKLTGTPFKVMTIAPVDTPIQDYPDIFAAAKAAADDINAKGGVAGHPIEVETCNDKSDPNGALACARKAVSDKVAAVTSSSVNGAKLYPPLQQAGITVIPDPATPADWTSDGVYPLSLGSTPSASAAVSAFKSAGRKSVAFVRADIGATAYKVPEVKAATERAGLKWLGDVAIPIDATDFAPYIQKLKQLGAEAAPLNTTATQAIQLAKTAKQMGLDVTFSNNAGTIGAPELKQLGPDGNGFVLVDGTPPPTSVGIPAVDAFNAAMKKQADAGVDGAEKLSARTVAAWLGMHALASVVGAAKPTGDITAAVVKDAIAKADSVDVEGVYDWKPNTPGPKDYPHVSNPSLYVGTVKDGKVQLGASKLDLYSFLGLQ